MKIDVGKRSQPQLPTKTTTLNDQTNVKIFEKLYDGYQRHV